MTKQWAIADTHFGHKNILIPDRNDKPHRNFASIEEMDSLIVQNWNQKVSKEDGVFVLGDVSFHNAEKTKEIISKLNGHKILVKGNHDNRSNDFYMECGFKEVSKYPIILDKLGLILSHIPLDVCMLGSNLNIHGHMHSLIDDYEKSYPLKYKCVSVENIDYTPRQIA